MVDVTRWDITAQLRGRLAGNREEGSRRRNGGERGKEQKSSCIIYSCHWGKRKEKCFDQLNCVLPYASVTLVKGCLSSSKMAGPLQISHKRPSVPHPPPKRAPRPWSPLGVGAEPLGEVTLTRVMPAEHWGIDQGLGVPSARAGGGRQGWPGGGRVAVVLRLVVWVEEQSWGLKGCHGSHGRRVGQAALTQPLADLLLTVHLSRRQVAPLNGL